MKPTRLLTLVGVVGATAFASLLITDYWARQGRSVFIAPATLVFTLPGIAVLLLGFAWPIVRYRRALLAATKAKSSAPIKRVDPFYAVRVLVLAKASAISASVILGWQIGLVFYLLSRPAQPTEGLARSISAGVAAVILLAVALIIERFCRLPNDGADSEAAA